MTGEQITVLFAVGAVCALTLLLGSPGLSRSTSDFFVASRRVPPWMNASAIAGEFLSAASFLGVAGLILAHGTYGLWFPVGYTAGFLILLLFMAAPLRRSGAYTLPDFVVLRFRSALMRRMTVIVVVAAGWLYIVPQLHGASIALSATGGAPGWVGPLLVSLVVLFVVLTGGMRSVTLAQAVQYWVKLTALLVPTVFILLQVGLWDRLQLPAFDGAWSTSLAAFGPAGDPWAEFSRSTSVLLALMMGTLGLPHVLVRFYTNPDGAAARRTTTVLMGLLVLFYLLPVVLGVVARLVWGTPAAAGEIARSGGLSHDTAILRLPAAVFDGLSSDLLTALIAGGAFAAFLSTTSGLVVSVSGVLSQEFFSGTVRGFRLGALLAIAVPLAVGTATSELALAGAVAMVFTFTASALAPVMLLGVWWRGLTAQGAIWGMAVGAVSSLTAQVLGLALGEGPVQPGALQLLVSPALWCVPLAFVVTVVVSRFGRGQPPAHTDAVMLRLHTPEVPARQDRR
ncbi:cation acetate symporter [Nesterenkonia halotolerans]|uniref:sodium/solute symporter n=1 Tax=Nesterenkonia halotolerans TaxID=225325 RepID=UPI003EE7E6F3